jgi:hypothetical protein
LFPVERTAHDLKRAGEMGQELLVHLRKLAQVFRGQAT